MFPHFAECDKDLSNAWSALATASSGDTDDGVKFSEDVVHVIPIAGQVIAILEGLFGKDPVKLTQAQAEAILVDTRGNPARLVQWYACSTKLIAHIMSPSGMTLGAPGDREMLEPFKLFGFNKFYVNLRKIAGETGPDVLEDPTFCASVYTGKIKPTQILPGPQSAQPKVAAAKAPAKDPKMTGGFSQGLGFGIGLLPGLIIGGSLLSLAAYYWPKRRP